jgi:NADH:quinone reductase (non-electrogenic)
LPTGHNGRVKVDRYLRVLDRPEIYIAGITTGGQVA